MIIKSRFNITAIVPREKSTHLSMTIPGHSEQPTTKYFHEIHHRHFESLGLTSIEKLHAVKHIDEGKQHTHIVSRIQQTSDKPIKIMRDL